MIPDISGLVLEKPDKRGLVLRSMWGAAVVVFAAGIKHSAIKSTLMEKSLKIIYLTYVCCLMLKVCVKMNQAWTL